MSQLTITRRVRRDGSIDPSKAKETRTHSKDSPEMIRAEIDAWAMVDPAYRSTVEGIREILRDMDSKRSRIEVPASVPRSWNRGRFHG